MKPDDENDRRPEPDQIRDPGAGPAASDVGGVDVGGVEADGGARPGTTDVQAYIGRQLRAVYEDVVRQPIPDRFLALMKQLEERDRDG